MTEMWSLKLNQQRGYPQYNVVKCLKWHGIFVRLQDEIDHVLEGRSYVDFDDLSRLEYAGQTFKETLRLYPVAPGTSRENTSEVTIEGYTIPKGTCLLVKLKLVAERSWLFDSARFLCLLLCFRRNATRYIVAFTYHRLVVCPCVCVCVCLCLYVCVCVRAGVHACALRARARACVCHSDGLMDHTKTI